MSVLHVNLLGGLRLLTLSGETLVLSAKKSAALFCYATMHAGREVPREKLAAMLWQDSGEAQARSSLRQSLVVLRKTLPEGVVAADNQSVTVDREAVEVDAHELERLLDDGSRESLERAVELYRGDLLDGFNPRAPGFDAWVMPERQRLRERALQGMVTLLESYRESGEPRAGIRAATRLLSLDPLCESVHRRLIELYAAVGRRDAALQQHRLCRETLRRELGVDTEPETDRLAERIRRARELPADPPSDAGAPTSPRPAARRQAFEADGHGPIGELRHVAVLVVSRAGEPAELGARDPEQLHAMLSRYVGCIERAARRHGGTVCRQFGEMVMVVFGIPAAHGYDAELAVRAAQAVHRELDALGRELGLTLRAQVGVAAGRVVADAGCDPKDAAGEIVGEPVSRAAALAARAPEAETLLSPAVHRSVSDHVEREPWPEGDGSGSPSAFRVRSVRESRVGSTQRPFVGRHAELGQVGAALRACMERGCGHTFVIRGEAGIGKSRFVDEVERVADELGFAAHRALVLQLGGGSAQDPIRTLTRSLIEAPSEPAELERAAQRLAEREALTDHERIHLHGLLDLPPPPGLDRLLDAMDAEARARGRRALLDRLVRDASAHRPRLLAVDDLHWADPSALDRIAALAGTVSDCPAVLIGTTRIEGEPLDEPAWREAIRDKPASLIDLSPLREAEAAELAAQFSGLTSEAVERCIERAEGNPLFLEQLLRNRAEGDEIPGTVHSLVLARLDDLPPADRRAAQAASVLGRRVPLRALRHVMDEESYVPDALLHEHLLRPVEAEEGGVWIFCHDLIADAVRASILAEERARLHARAAEHYAGKDAVLQAEHLERSGARSAAADAYLCAARQRAEERSPEAARRLAERGLVVADATGVRCELEMVRADSLRQLGRTGGALEAYERAGELAADDGERARAWLGKASALRTLDRFDEAFEALSHAERAAKRSYRTVELSRAQYERGSAHFPRGDLDACLEAHRKALELARRAGSAWDEARALSGLGDAYYQRGALRTAAEHFERCVAIAREHGFGGIETANQAMVVTIGVFLLRKDALPGAYRLVRAAEAADDVRTALVARGAAIALLDWRGEWEALERDAGEAFELAERMGAARFEAAAVPHLSVAMAARGRGERARAILQTAYERGREAGLAFYGPIILGAMALASEDPARRRELLDEAQELLDGGCVSHNYLRFYPYGMYVAWALGDAERLERYAEALEAYAASEPLPWTDLFGAWGRTLAQALRGEVDGAALRALRERLAEQELSLAAAPLDVLLGNAEAAPFTRGCAR